MSRLDGKDVIHPAVRVMLEESPRNWSAYVPAIPGCVATGRNRGDVQREIEAALARIRLFTRPVPGRRVLLLRSRRARGGAARRFAVAIRRAFRLPLRGPRT